MKNTEYSKQIGIRIKNFRINKKLTQEQLSELVGCSKTHIGHIEKGYVASLEMLINIVNVLEITLDDICCDTLLYANKIFAVQLSELFENCTSEEISALNNICNTALKELRYMKQNRKG